MESLLKIKAQRGYLLILAIVIIVIVAFVGVTLVRMFIGGSSSESNVALSSQAFYIANSGMEIAKRDIVVNKIACTAINGTTKYTAANRANGQFTVIGSANAAASTITTDINDTEASPSVVLANANGFTAEGGVVRIDNELFYYSSIISNTLQNVKRGVSGTFVAAHNSGSNILQNQCVLTSTGAVPTIAAASAKRTIREVLPALDKGFSIDGMYAVLVALGAVQMAGTPFIINPSVWYTPTPASPDYPGSTIVTTGTLQIAGTGGTKVCGGNDNAALAVCDSGSGFIVSSSPHATPPIKPDVVQNYAGISGTNLFSKIFTVTKTQMRNYVLSSSPSATTQYFASGLTSLTPLNGIVGKTIWVNGMLQIAGSETATVGSPTKPVILIINGGIQFAGSSVLTVYGLMYTIGGLQNAGSGSLNGKGAFVLEGGVQLAGSGFINLDPKIIAQLPTINPYVAVEYNGNSANRQEIFQ